MSGTRAIILLILVGGLDFQAGASSYTLVTEPDQGLTPIYNLISSAKSTLDMTMYELTDTQAEQLLAQAAASGVTVRVILDQNLEKSSNTAAYNYLDSQGVEVHWANPTYSATHQKTITVDGSISAIMTLNLTSQYYSTSRDFAVIENDPIDVAAIESTFNADFANSAVQPPDGDDLVWSPTNSQSAILGVINSAQRSLLVENEEMGDTNVVNALVSAAGRGVLVQVVMTNTSNDYATEFTQLVAAGVGGIHVRFQCAALYSRQGDPGRLRRAGRSGVHRFREFFQRFVNKKSRAGSYDFPIQRSCNPSTVRSQATSIGGTPWPGSQSGLAIVNGASLQPGFASGAWITIFGTNLAAKTDDWTNSIVNGQLPTSLDGVTVTVDGQPAYLAYISPTQINAVAPEVNTGTVSVTVDGPNQANARAMATAETLQPAFFQLGNYAVATHLDYSSATQAAPGDSIILWGTGFGPTSPAAPIGAEVPPGPVYQTASLVTVTVGNAPAIVYGAALAPGFAALYQVAIQIPESLADGDYPVVATVSGVQSPSSVLLTVRK